MESLYIEASAFTPEIIMQPEKSAFRISGNSYPESPENFYKPLFEWIQKYISSNEIRNEFPIQFEYNYFNTSTSKVIAKLFRLIESSPNASKVIINWNYDVSDKDMFNAGRRYSSLYKIKFQLNPVSINSAD